MKIREKVSGIVGFPVQGKFKTSLELLDRTGAVDKKKQLDMILALCESIEELEIQIDGFKTKKANKSIA